MSSKTETAISSTGSVNQTIDPNVFYDFTGALTALNITLGTPTSGKINEYNFQFLSGATPLYLVRYLVGWWNSYIRSK